MNEQFWNDSIKGIEEKHVDFFLSKKNGLGSKMSDYFRLLYEPDRLLILAYPVPKTCN